MSRLAPRSRGRQQGFTLVEVMVTVFVVAVGLLSAAALQAVSKKASLDAVQRTTATVLAQDMIERIRANRAQLADYAVNDLSDQTAPAAPGCGTGTDPDCTAAQLVAYDLHHWWRSVAGSDETIADGSGGSEAAGGLRDPAGCIRVIGQQIDVVVTWRGMSKISQVPEANNEDDPTDDACGELLVNEDNQPLYEAEGTESYRRVLRLRAFVS